MYIIKLDAIDSTNSYLKAMSAVNLPKDFTVVVADHQTQGRGQMGTVWQTEDGKHLDDYMGIVETMQQYEEDQKEAAHG